MKSRKLSFVTKESIYSLLKYTPSLLNPLLPGFEKTAVSRRIRLAINQIFRVGYTVYYLAEADEIVATCTVVKGKGLLWMCTDTDISIEMVYVPHEFRGHGYTKKLLELLLMADIKYDTAYAWISKRNPASFKSFEAAGFEVCGECEVKRFSRKLYYNEEGYNLVNIYKRKKFENNTN